MSNKKSRCKTEKAISDPISNYGWDISLDICGKDDDVQTAANIIEINLRNAWKEALRTIRESKLPVELREERWE